MKRKGARKKSKSPARYIVEATVRSKRLTAALAKALKAKTKKQLKGAKVKVKKVA